MKHRIHFALSSSWRERSTPVFALAEDAFQKMVPSMEEIIRKPKQQARPAPPIRRLNRSLGSWELDGRRQVLNGFGRAAHGEQGDGEIELGYE